MSKHNMAWWGVLVLLPFVTTWTYSDYATHNGGLMVHSEYPIPIYLMSGLLTVLAVWIVCSSGYRFWGKVFLSCLSVVIVVSMSFLGAIFEFFHSGFNLGP